MVGETEAMAESIIESGLLWLFLVAISVLTGRACSAYFPFLATSKFYYEIKSPKLKGILISPHIDRTLTIAADYKDRNKLPLIGCIWYIMAFPMITVGYFFLTGYRLGAITQDAPLMFFLGKLFTTIFPAYLYFMPIAIILYRVDYYLGKRINPDT